MTQPKDSNQGEGDRASARRYDQYVREFIDEGKVDEAADEAKRFVETEPAEAAAAEEMGKRGPGGRGVTVEELVAKGRSLVERARPAVERTVGKLRKRFGKK